MANPDVGERSRRAARERARKLDEGVPQRGNHPGSRYGGASEERPDLAPEKEPAVVADVRPEDVPEGGVAGALPENEGDDPADLPARDGKRRPG